MRKLVCCLAVRNDGSRLFGKPMQNLDYINGYSILDYILDELNSFSDIDEIVLGISEGDNNFGYRAYCKKRNLKYIIGDQVDVLSRLIKCAELVDGTDVFRITSESPFIYGEMVTKAWRSHITDNNDLTVIEGVPDGCAFEIISLEALKRSHRDGSDRHRSELCSLFIRENKKSFKMANLDIPKECIRPDLRLTVDYPEDLVLCRSVYQKFKDQAPNIPLMEIIDFLDKNEDLKRIVSPFAESAFKP